MEEFKEKINFIKRQFSTDDSNSYCQAAFCLLKTLNENEDTFIDELLKSNVMMNVLERINVSNQKCILESLKLIVDRWIMVKIEFIDKFITSINIHDLTNSKEEATMTLNIFHILLSQQLEINTAQGILLIKKHAAKLLNFINQMTFEWSSFLTTTKLFNFVIKYSGQGFQQIYFPTIHKMYCKAMDYLLTMKDHSYFERIRAACCISFSIANICSEIEVIEEQLEKEIFDKIKQLAVKHVIPMLKISEIDIKCAEDFIDFLKITVNSKFYDNYELCFDLVENYYLKFLLNLSVFDPERPDFRSKVCSLISEIIVSLVKHFEFPLSDWEGGVRAFQNFLCTGLEQISLDSSKWEENLKISHNKSSSLLVLLYCHFLVTNEQYVFTKQSLAVHLMSSDMSCMKRIFVKILWLLYAVSPITAPVPDFFRATNKLTNVLQRQENIDIYYTHHESFLLFTMKNVSISDEIRVQVIRLWIDQSNSNEEFNLLIKKCFDHGYNDLKIVKILMDLIHGNSMKNVDNAKKVFAALMENKTMSLEVVEYILETLTKDLIKYNSNNDKTLRTVLVVASNLPLLLSLSKDIVSNCANELRNVVVKKNLDSNLESLLLPMCVFLIQQSLDASHYKVGKIFLKNDEFLNVVFHNSFNSECTTLIQSSFYILTGLLLFHEKATMEFQCETMVYVKWRKIESVSYKIIMENQSQIFLVIFIKQLLLNNQLASPLIGLRKKSEAADLNNLLRIYYLIHNISNEIALEQRGEIYECLSTILYDCFFKRLDFNSFLTCPETYDLFKMAIDGITNSEEPNYTFQDFAMTWVRHVQWATINKQFELNLDAKRSLSLLIDLRLTLVNMKKKDILIEDFCIVVENYLSFDDY